MTVAEKYPERILDKKNNPAIITNINLWRKPMNKTGILCVGIILAFSGAVNAQSVKPAATLVKPAVSMPSPIPSGMEQDLSNIQKSLGDLVGRLDSVKSRLGNVSKMVPGDAELAVTNTATILGGIVDSLRDEGDILLSIHAVKEAAQRHKERVQSIPKNDINEADRSNVLAKWDSVLQTSDKMSLMSMAMREKVLALITTLRLRQVGISELILVDSYGEALRSLGDWMSELDKIINELHKTIVPVPGV
jgi:hypothetical protein